MTLITCSFDSFKKVSRWASLSKYFNKPLREKCGYRKLLKKHFCWILPSIFSVFDFSKVAPFLYINALRHVCRRWPISTRSWERKTKIFRRKSVKIVQKLLGAIQFFNLERQYCHFYSILMFRKVISFILSFLCNQKDFSVILAIYFSKLPFLPFLLARWSTIIGSQWHTNIFLCGHPVWKEIFCFSSPIKAAIGRYVMWIEKAKYETKLNKNLLAENQD